jgi:hypothetical protein
MPLQIATDLRSTSKQRLTKVIDSAFLFAMSKIPFNRMQNISAYTQSNTNAYRHSTKLATYCWKLLLYLATEVSCLLVVTKGAAVDDTVETLFS